MKPMFPELSRICFALCLALACGFAPARIAAQVDPFAPNPNPTPPPATEGESGEETAPAVQFPPNPIIDSIRESAPQSAEKLVRAIRITLDLNRPDEAKRYLTNLAIIDLDDQQLFALSRRIGIELTLRMRHEEALQPVGGEFADRLLAATQRVESNPARLDALVRTLNDPDLDIRSEALRELLQLGAPGAAAIINVFADPDRQKEYLRLRAALKRFGRDALPALIAGSRANHAQVRTDSLFALAWTRSSGAVPWALLPAVAADTPDATRRVAQNTLNQLLNQVPDPAMMQNIMDRAIAMRLDDDMLTSELAQSEVVIFSWDDQSRSLAAQSTTRRQKRRAEAALLARDLYRISPSAENLRRFLLTHFEAKRIVSGRLRSTDSAEFVEFCRSAGTDFIQQVLADALDRGHYDAAIGAVQMLGEIGDARLLSIDGMRLSPVVRSLDSGNMRLMFAAVEAISNWQPSAPFAGSSKYFDALVYLATFQSRPSVLVAEPSGTTANQLASAVSASGFSPVLAATVLQTREIAQNDPSIEIMLITDLMSRPDYAELVQQLRATPRSSGIPILLLVDESHMDRANRLAREDPLLDAFPLTIDPELIARQLSRVQGLSGTASISSVERMEFARQAVEWLKQIVLGEHAGNYPIASIDERVIELLNAPSLARSAVDMLGQIGTPLAQRRLVELVGLATVPLEVREAAVNAFQHAISQRGVLLTTAELQQRYNRYNGSVGEDAETQRLLGAILDIIEARAKKVADDSN